jgi:GntR family transcriptional regulator/MocR family aminotransferase
MECDMARHPEAFLDHLFLDSAAVETLSAQLSRALRSLAVSGGIAAGARLPSSRILARRLGVSRNTVAAAYDQLAAEGYVEAVQGGGTFITAACAEVTHGSAAPARTAMPGLSRRGRLLDSLSPSPAATAPLVFTPGVPALDAFPLEEWRKLLSRSGRRLGREALWLADPRGWPPLRAAIAAHLGPARGVVCQPDQVIVLASARQAVDLAARLLADPGDQVWVEEPGYGETRVALIAAGTAPAPVPVDGEGIDVAAGAPMAPAARLACVTPSHQYPLGATMSLKRRLALIDWARQAGAIIVEDDYDGEFRYGGQPLTALYGLDGGDRVIYVGSFSKSMFPSLRLAYMVSPPGLADAFAGARSQLDGHAAALGQAALAEFMASGGFGAHLRRMRALYRARQEALLHHARHRLSGALTLDRSLAGLHLVGRLPAGMDDQALTTRLAGAAPAPLSRYYAGARSEPGLILGYAGWDEPAIAAGVLSLAKALDRQVAP